MNDYNHNEAIEEAIRNIEHQSDIAIEERRHQEDLELKKAELEESRKANKLSKAALIVSIIGTAISLTISIIALIKSTLIG